MITERQGDILFSVIDEYIRTASPVSSGTIFDLGNLAVSCPTIRNEMANLTEHGYLVQPHTSSGRIPTERGYRFFVDRLISTFSDRSHNRSLRKSVLKKSQIFADAIKSISAKVNDVVLFMDEDGEVKYIGLKKIFSNPEFQSAETIVAFIDELERFENSFDSETLSCHTSTDEIEVFIGSENPFFERGDYGMVVSRSGGDFISLLGPMRMDYRHNISILEKFL